jgi:D-alanyl-D-alanine carboxypeptidase
VLPTTSLPRTTVPVPKDWDAFDASLKDALVGSGAWGISIAIAKDGKIIHTAAEGVADPDTERKAVPSDRYRLASNSKVLTAIVVMQLVADGRLSLDEKITPMVADGLGVTITEPGIADITVRELLSHTSGFNEYQRTFFGHRVDNCPEAAKVGLTNGLMNPPGTAYMYSNMNFCILGLVIEDVTGRKYEDVVDDSLLHPLGIDDMRIAGTLDVRKGDAHHLSGELRNYMEVLYSAGAWVGTASDLVTILDSLDTTRPGWHPLDEATVAEMLAAPTVPYPFPGRWYGLGLRAWEDGSWGHTGTVENARSMVVHRPDGYTWAVMVNGDAPSNTDKLADLVEQAFAAVGVPSPDVG